MSREQPEKVLEVLTSVLVIFGPCRSLFALTPVMYVFCPVIFLFLTLLFTALFTNCPGQGGDHDLSGCSEKECDEWVYA